MGIICRSIVVVFGLTLFPLSLSAANGELTFAGNGTVILGSNSSLVVGGDLKVGLATSAATVICKPSTNHPTISRTYFNVTGNMVIAAGSTISADAQGYLAQYGPLSPSDYTSTINASTNYSGKDFTGQSSSGGGGSNGGAAGAGNNGGVGGLAFGGGASPINCGSGGGRGQGGIGQYAAGGAGGGAIQITVGSNLTLNGDLRANGQAGFSLAGAGGGGGGGGSIVITTIGIGGTGAIRANGGNGGTNGGGGGSGGRIVITYFNGALPPTVTVTGGTGSGGGGNGADGSSSTQPQSPSNFAGTPDSTTIMTWSWTDNSPNETGFVIHDDVGHVQVGSVAANVTSWQENNLSENSSYGRHVHAVISSVESNSSNSTSPYTLVHTPLSGDFTPSALSSWQIRITVTAPPNGTAGQTGVRIEQSPDNNNFTILSDFSTNYTVTHQPLLDEMTYYYRITFRNGDGVATALSPVNNATTQLVPVPAITTPNKKTNDTTPLVAGTSVEGFTVKVYEGTNLLGSTTVPAGGSWSLSTSQLPESPHVLIATATDLGANESAISNSTTITIDITPPAAPQELTATPINGEIHLAWQANGESDLRGYNIYRKGPGEQNFTKINTQVVTAANYCDSGLANGQPYEYKITAVDDTLIEQ